MPARAEPLSAMETDRQFIGSLETVLGKDMPNTANAIGAAHAVCALGYTRPPAEIEALVKTDLAATDWTEGTVGYFIQTAKVSYCPQYVD